MQRDSFSDPASPALTRSRAVCFAGPPPCEVLNQSDLGRQLQQTPHILETWGEENEPLLFFTPGPPPSLS